MRALSLCSFALMSVVGVMASAAELELNKGDHICLVGNALGERMQHQNQWESLLHQRFPELELTVRNLCFPGDEPLGHPQCIRAGVERQRPAEHRIRLRNVQPDADGKVRVHRLKSGESLADEERIDGEDDHAD